MTGTMTGPKATPDRQPRVRGKGRALLGAVDYTLAKRALLRDFRQGILSRFDICDAHPELLRAARNIGERTSRECPICDEADVVLVSFAFGPGLPASGRCVESTAELAKLAKRRNDLACYVVEVCTECSWNHLARTYVIGNSRTPA